MSASSTFFLNSAASYAGAPPAVDDMPANTSLAVADVYELKDAVVIKLDVPGLAKGDVKVRITDGSVQVSGRRIQDVDPKNAHALMAERRFGYFSRYVHLQYLLCSLVVSSHCPRIFKLPDSCDLDKIHAVCEHGVVTITIHKALSVQMLTAIAQTEEGDGALNAEFAAVSINTFPLPASGDVRYYLFYMSLS